MPKPKVHFFICTNKRPEGHPRGCCADRGVNEVLNALGSRIQETQAWDKAMVSMTSSCLGPCGMGPIVVVYPDNVWYGNMDADKAAQVFDSHVNEGKAVESLALPEGSF